MMGREAVSVKLLAFLALKKQATQLIKIFVLPDSADKLTNTKKQSYFRS
jgi:hypothetical protein